MKPTLFPKSHLPLVHARFIVSGEIHDPFVAGNILESLLLAAPSSHSQARLLLSSFPRRSAFIYNTLLHAYITHNLPSAALHLFDEMRRSDTIPNKHTFPLLLKALAQTRRFGNGASLHSMIIKYGFSADRFVHASLIHFYGSLGRVLDARRILDEDADSGVSAFTALLSGYAKAGHLSAAREVFDGMPERNLVSWSAMISGYVQFGRPDEALVLFREMMAVNLQPTCPVLASILVAAAELGALPEGKWVHGFLERSRMPLSSNLTTSLVHMYAKCGDLPSAKQTFERSRDRSVDLWNAMIAGLGLHGRGQEASELFADMMADRVRPDDMTFVCLLSAYSHSGMVSDGQKCFESMSRVYKIEPKEEHYGCMVDLLGRFGFVVEAIQLVETMPMRPSDGIWGSLFTSCGTHGDIGLGEALGKCLIEMEPYEPGCYVRLANLYASCGRWKDALSVRAAMKSRGVGLEPGCSQIEVDGVVHEFLA